ncbi:hypothetical protein ABID58_000691 [Bradyrhizobium sp. S3.2.6]|uniref:hypothetical protein n=1 Tax=Bradyrhizobium sp. S3.2.6 TaxID=3156428 RepID=UPI00339A07F7
MAWQGANGLIAAIAIATVLVAVGQFLDKYHISSRAKEKARLMLVRWFVALDDLTIPDLPRKLLIVVLRPDKRLSLILLFVLYALYLPFCLILLVSFLLEGGLLGIAIIFMIMSAPYVLFEPDVDLWKRLVVAAFLLFFFLIVPALCFMILRIPFRRLYNSDKALIRFLSPFAAGAILVIAIAAMLVALSLFDAEDVATSSLILATTLPVMFLVFLTFALLVVKLFVQLTRKTAMVVFQAASDPQNSPFSYAAGFLGLIVVAVKFFVGEK